MQLQLLEFCNKKRSVFVAFYDMYFVDIEKYLYFAASKTNISNTKYTNVSKTK